MRDIFDAPSREDAEELKGKVVKKFEKIAPEFVSWLEENVDEGLTVFDFRGAGGEGSEPSTDWRDCTGRSGDEPGWWESFPTKRRRCGSSRLCLQRYTRSG